jgi:hypothetical protein
MVSNLPSWALGVLAHHSSRACIRLLYGPSIDLLGHPLGFGAELHRLALVLVLLNGNTK